MIKYQIKLLNYNVLGAFYLRRIFHELKDNVYYLRSFYSFTVTTCVTNYSIFFHELEKELYSLREKCPDTEFFSGAHFPVFGLNTGKYGPEKTRIWTLHSDSLSYSYHLYNTSLWPFFLLDLLLCSLGLIHFWQFSHFIPPENTRKPKVFVVF